MESYQIKPIVTPSGSVIALDLKSTVTNTTGLANAGIVHVANSVACHASFSGTFEVQTVAVTPVAAVTYTLTVGSTVLTSSALGASPTLAQLVTSLQADIDYAAAAFIVEVNGTTGVKLTWKAPGNQTDTAVMTDTALTAYVTVTTNGTGGVNTNCTLLMAGERTFLIDSGVLSFVKATGALDGIIRITYCQ